MDLDDDELRFTRIDNGTASKEELLEEIKKLKIENINLRQQIQDILYDEE